MASTRGDIKHKTKSQGDTCASLVQHSPYGMYRADPEGNFLTFNPALAQIYGFPCPETFAAYLETPESRLDSNRDFRKEIRERLQREGRIEQIVHQIITAQGERQWVSESCIAERDEEDGRLIAYEGYVEILKSPAELALDTEKRFQAIFDQVKTVAVQGYDRNRRVIYWNRASTELFGYSACEAMGQRIEDLVIPRDKRGQVVRQHQRWLTDNEPIPAGEMELLRKDGRQVPVFSNHIMLLNAFGEPEMYCIDVELTQIKKAERALRIAKEQAERASHAKSAFLAAISHELRTPLNAIIGFSEVMERQLYGDLGHVRYREYAQDIHASGAHLLGIINDILDLSKIEADDLHLVPADVSLSAMVAHCAQALRKSADEKSIKFLSILPNGLPLLRIDENSLRQILMNLLSNAIKFTPKGGQVMVNLTYDRSLGFRIIITDSGIGMSDEEIQHALRPFTQVDNSLGRKYTGMGLGLPLSRSLTMINGGTFLIESTPDIGTAITLHFPTELAVGREFSPHR